MKTQVAKGVDPCSVDKKGTSAIHFAASKGHLDVVLFLLSKGVDIDMEDQSGRSPLHYAVLGESNEVVKALMKKSAWIDAYDKDDDTPLHLAARWVPGQKSYCSRDVYALDLIPRSRCEK